MTESINISSMNPVLCVCTCVCSCVYVCVFVCVCTVSTAMHESSKNLQSCLGDMYEPEWYGKDEVDSILEVSRTPLKRIT